MDFLMFRSLFIITHLNVALTFMEVSGIFKTVYCIS